MQDRVPNVLAPARRLRRRVVSVMAALALALPAWLGASAPTVFAAVGPGTYESDGVWQAIAWGDALMLWAPAGVLPQYALVCVSPGTSAPRPTGCSPEFPIGSSTSPIHHLVTGLAAATTYTVWEVYDPTKPGSGNSYCMSYGQSSICTSGGSWVTVRLATFQTAASGSVPLETLSYNDGTRTLTAHALRFTNGVWIGDVNGQIDEYLWYYRYCSGPTYVTLSFAVHLTGSADLDAPSAYSSYEGFWFGGLPDNYRESLVERHTTPYCSSSYPAYVYPKGPFTPELDEPNDTIGFASGAAQPQVRVSVTSYASHSATWYVDQQQLGPSGQVLSSTSGVWSGVVPQYGQPLYWTTANQQPGYTYAYATRVNVDGQWYYGPWEYFPVTDSPRLTSRTTSSLAVQWDAVYLGAPYTVRYRPWGGAWTTAGTTSTPSYSIAGLTPNSRYEVCDQPSMPNGGPAYWWCDDFWTLAAPPAGLEIANLTTTGFTVTWDPNGNPGYTRYQAQVRLSDGTVEQTTDATPGEDSANTASFTGLASGVQYQVFVRAENEEGVWTAWVPGPTFVTPTGETNTFTPGGGGTVVGGTGEGGPTLDGGGGIASSTGVAGTVTLNGQGIPTRFTNSATVDVQTLRDDPFVRFSFDGVTWGEWWSNVKGMVVAVTLPAGDGQKAVYAQYKALSGATSQVYGLGFTLDTQAPVVAASWLGNASVTAGGKATLVLSASDNLSPPDALQVRVVVNGAAGPWQPFSDAVPVTFTRSGVNLVTVQVRDQAGNVASRSLSIYN